MALFRRRRSPAPIDWTDRSDLGIAQRAREVAVEMGMTATEVRGTDSEDLELVDGDLRMPLYNLISRMRLSPRDEWDEIVRRHLRIVSTREFDPGALDEHELRQRVRTRLLSDGEGGPSVHGYARPFAPGLVLALCIDMPETVATVTDGDVDRLALPVDALFDIGARNVNDELVDDVNEIAPGVWALEGDSLFTGTRASDLPELLTASGIDAPLGAVFAVPTRHLVLTVPVEASALERIGQLAGVVRSIVTGQQGAIPGGPVSGNLYFWGVDGYECVGFEQPDEDRIDVLVTPRFQSALEAAGALG